VPHLEENMAAARIDLSDAQFAELRDATPPPDETTD
jgi:aryl-alcohol dehydrogenase-like predicted oxidoreductase